jgi:hypothetical protein
MPCHDFAKKQKSGAAPSDRAALIELMSLAVLVEFCAAS